MLKSKSFIKNIDEIRCFDVLGSGQSGYVCQGIHIPTKKIIAIKQISVYEKGKRHQIMNEFNALFDTKCVGLVGFYGIFFSKGYVSIALEYCECGSLLNILNKTKTIPENILKIITKNILNGLIYLHDIKKQVHRDLKPSNICINKNGDAKLTDFGISRELKDSMSKCKTYVGTITYMSPERIRAEEYSFKSDIWGLGLTLMQCYLGYFPYPNTPYYLELIHYIANEASPKFPKNIKISKEFKSFIYACINKNPNNRPNAKDLMNHEWIKSINNNDINIKKWIKDNDLILKLPEIKEIK